MQFSLYMVDSSLPSLLGCETSFATGRAALEPESLAVKALPSLEDVAVLLVLAGALAPWAFYCPLSFACLAGRSDRDLAPAGSTAGRRRPPAPAIPSGTSGSDQCHCCTCPAPQAGDQAAAGGGGHGNLHQKVGR